MRIKHAEISVVLFLATILVFELSQFCSAQNILPEQVQRSQEMIQKEEQLQKKIDKPIKRFIKQILISGAKLLTEEQLNNAVSAFQNHWLGNDELDQISDSIKALYQQSGFNQFISIYFEFSDSVLNINIKEEISNV